MGYAALPESVCDRVESKEKPRRDSSFSEMSRAPVALKGSQEQRESASTAAMGSNNRWAGKRIFTPYGPDAGHGPLSRLHAAPGLVHFVKDRRMDADGDREP